jgi:hypothetical protein
MTKYEPLTRFLAMQTTSELPITFQEVERILGFKLPNSAYQHRPWWANEASNHVHAKAWLKGGYQTEQVDMAGRKLVFKRVQRPANSPQGKPVHGGMAEPQRGFKHEETPHPLEQHPALGAMKGWLWIEPGYDLTQPTMPEWPELMEKKYGPEKPK